MFRTLKLTLYTSRQWSFSYTIIQISLSFEINTDAFPTTAVDALGLFGLLKMTYSISNVEIEHISFFMTAFIPDKGNEGGDLYFPKPIHQEVLNGFSLN